jgi:hypothetical protein
MIGIHGRSNAFQQFRLLNKDRSTAFDGVEKALNHEYYKLKPNVSDALKSALASEEERERIMVELNEIISRGESDTIKPSTDMSKMKYLPILTIIFDRKPAPAIVGHNPISYYTEMRLVLERSLQPDSSALRDDKDRNDKYIHVWILTNYSHVYNDFMEIHKTLSLLNVQESDKIKPCYFKLDDENKIQILPLIYACMCMLDSVANQRRFIELILQQDSFAMSEFHRAIESIMSSSRRDPATSKFFSHITFIIQSFIQKAREMRLQSSDGRRMSQSDLIKRINDAVHDRLSALDADDVTSTPMWRHNIIQSIGTNLDKLDALHTALCEEEKKAIESQTNETLKKRRSSLNHLFTMRNKFNRLRTAAKDNDRLFRRLFSTEEIHNYLYYSLDVDPILHSSLRNNFRSFTTPYVIADQLPKANSKNPDVEDTRDLKRQRKDDTTTHVGTEQTMIPPPAAAEVQTPPSTNAAPVASPVTSSAIPPSGAASVGSSFVFNVGSIHPAAAPAVVQTTFVPSAAEAQTPPSTKAAPVASPVTSSAIPPSGAASVGSSFVFTAGSMHPAAAPAVVQTTFVPSAAEAQTPPSTKAAPVASPFHFNADVTSSAIPPSGAASVGSSFVFNAGSMHPAAAPTVVQTAFVPPAAEVHTPPSTNAALLHAGPEAAGASTERERAFVDTKKRDAVGDSGQPWKRGLFE